MKNLMEVKTKYIFIFLILSIGCFGKVKTGLDVFTESEWRNYKGKKLALITNHTGITSDFRRNYELLIEKELDLVKIFTPEHGFDGSVSAGKSVGNSNVSQIEIVSLYGNNKKPRKNQMKNFDVMIYDIQDIGVRTYTYISTLVYCMQSAAESKKDFVVLDRPIPIKGNIVDGNILERNTRSFIGIAEIPYIYGMTVGEFARYINSEWNLGLNLEVVKMQNYNREMDFIDTELPWIATSPNIPAKESAYYYALTGNIGELGVISEGVGTANPFELLGAEWINGKELEREINALNLSGVKVLARSWTPRWGRFKDQNCNGVQIFITDKDQIEPYYFGLKMLELINRMYPEKKIFSNKKDHDLFIKALGSKVIYNSLVNDEDIDELYKWINQEKEKFLIKREKYLIY